MPIKNSGLALRGGDRRQPRFSARDTAFRQRFGATAVMAATRDAAGLMKQCCGVSAAQSRPEAGAESQNIGPIVHPQIDDLNAKPTKM
jgi:hypothetical protein